MNGSVSDTYLVTGMTGYLGSVVVRYLLERGNHVAGLLLPGEKNPFPDVPAVIGDITDKESLQHFFAPHPGSIVIHCAGFVSISAFDRQKLWNVNVIGTRNMVDMAVQFRAKKFIYISSVHAIPEQPDGVAIAETEYFDSTMVTGDYAKTKAEATKYVIDAARQGLSACVVHPSGMIGPYDPGQGQMTTVLKMFLRGQLPAGVKGGYDFVDVRDVAEGIIECCDCGKSGACYILSGHGYSVKDFLELAAKSADRKPPQLYLSPKLLMPFAVLWEKLLHCLGKSTVFTPYSLYTLCSNSRFSHEKASRELGYTTRGRDETIADMVQWTKTNGLSE